MGKVRIHIHDAVASSKVRAHSQFTQADYDYLCGKGWTDAEILKRWDEEAGKGAAPQRGNKNAKPGQPGYVAADAAPCGCKNKAKDAPLRVVKDPSDQRFLAEKGELFKIENGAYVKVSPSELPLQKPVYGRAGNVKAKDASPQQEFQEWKKRVQAKYPSLSSTDFTVHSGSKGEPLFAIAARGNKTYGKWKPGTPGSVE